MAVKWRQITGLWLLILSIWGCAKENVLPDLPVNFSAPISDPRLNRLSTGGGAVAINGYGLAGLIIYRRIDGAYMAYDRCSTVNPEQRNPLVIDEPSITATDPVSGAKYLLEDGSPAKAPAKSFLKRYQVILAGNTIHVTN